MCPPDDKYTVVYVVPPSTNTDETVDALQDDKEIIVETVRSTRAGRERLDAGDVDCVVSDYQLPDGDGLALLETVREDHAQLPFVLYTAAGSETVAVEAFRRGVTDYVRRSAADARTALRDCVRNALAVTDDYRDRTSELPQVHRVAHGRTELEALTTRYRLALDGTDTGIWEWDLDTDELVWDRRAERLAGYDPGEFAGTADAFTDRVHPEDLEVIETAREQAIETGSYEAEYRIVVDGRERWLHTRAEVFYHDDGTPDRMLGVGWDITDRKRRQRELAETRRDLEETKEYYRRLFEESSDFVLVTDEAGTVNDITPGVEHVLGHEPDELIGTDAFNHVHPEDEDRLADAMAEVIQNPETNTDIEYRSQASDGSYRWLEARGRNLLDDPLLDGLVASVRDISARKEAEQAVEDAKAYYKRLFQQASDYVTVTDEAGTITNITPGVERVLGYEPAEIIDTNAFSLIHPDDCERVRGVLTDVVENPEMEISMEYRARTESGDYRWMEARGSSYLDDRLLDGVVVYVRDITQQKERQQELARKTARLRLKNEQLERLAQIVSHDLQTPLSTAEKLTGLLRSDLADPDPAVEQSLSDLEVTHQRLRAFADHLPRLARESTDIEESTACDIGSIAEAAWEVVDTGPLELRVESTWRLDGDPERLQRAFENLVQNTVVHGVRAVDDEQIAATTVRVGAVDDGFYIADDGPGIRPEQRAELFEYGMGTGSGSGFGLAIVRTIIEAHGWTITVTDSRSGGARFEVETT